MNEKEVRSELSRLQKMKSELSAALSQAPEGRLRLSKSGGKYFQYFLTEEVEGSAHAKRRFLRKSEQELAISLAQKEYNRKLLGQIERRERELLEYEKYLSATPLQQVYESLPEGKKLLVTPRVLPDDLFLEQWYAALSGEANTFPITDGILTERGELVRSKSEKMIADKLFYKNIPYQYEAPLRITQNKCIFPDFTILNVRTRKTYYLEHFGMMDDPAYCRKALEKIELYEENGYYQMESLLYTMESSQKGIQIRLLEHIVSRFLT